MNEKVENFPVQWPAVVDVPGEAALSVSKKRGPKAALGGTATQPPEGRVENSFLMKFLGVWKSDGGLTLAKGKHKLFFCLLI